MDWGLLWVSGKLGSVPLSSTDLAWIIQEASLMVLSGPKSYEYIAEFIILVNTTHHGLA